jgi:hypothetical protein
LKPPAQTRDRPGQVNVSDRDLGLKLDPVLNRRVSHVGQRELVSDVLALFNTRVVPVLERVVQIRDTILFYLGLSLNIVKHYLIRTKALIVSYIGLSSLLWSRILGSGALIVLFVAFSV